MKGDFIQFDDQGKPSLSPERLAKKEKEQSEIRNCVVYSLRAKKADWYDCFHSSVDKVWLKPKEVGHTYSNGSIRPRLGIII